MGINNSQKKTCTFLFGAGADSQFGLVNGDGFNESLLTNRFINERKKLLGEEYAAHKLIFHNSRTIFLQTISEHKKDAKNFFDEDIILKCCNYFETGNDKDKEDVIDYCNSWSDYFTKSTKRETKHIAKDKEITFFLKYATFFTTLDEKFNELRHSDVTVRGKRVINAYYIVFLLMLEGVFNLDDINWTLESIWELLRSQEYKIDLSIDSYYKTLAESNLKFNVVTTNYTSIAEKIIKQEITYLHGNLCWFEDLNKLTVFDCKKNDELESLRSNQKSLLPFILIPSGIKPLICRKQIEQFSTFINKLDESSLLVVVGYKFNSEDNHINSIIADWLRKDNHKLIYLNFKGELDWKNCSWISEFNSSNQICINSNIDNIFLPDSKIVDIITNESNSQKTFNTIVNILKEEN